MQSKKLFSFVLTLFFCFMTSCVFAVDAPPVALELQIVQANFSLNKDSIKTASVIMENGQYKGMRVQLKKPAAQAFSQLTSANINKTLQLVFEDHVLMAAPIRSTLGGDFLVTGIGLQDAQLFINKLKAEQGRTEPAKQPFVLDVGKEAD